MPDITQIGTDMEVESLDGRHLGKVTSVAINILELIDGDLEHREIPLSWVGEVSANKVRLARTEPEVRSQWLTREGRTVRPR